MPVKRTINIAIANIHGLNTQANARRNRDRGGDWNEATRFDFNQPFGGFLERVLLTGGLFCIFCWMTASGGVISEMKEKPIKFYRLWVTRVQTIKPADLMPLIPARSFNTEFYRAEVRV